MKLHSLLSCSLIGLGAAQRSLTVENNCAETVWPAIFSDTSETLEQPTGWEAKPKSSVTFTLPKEWRGRVWGRTQCEFGDNSKSPLTCLTGGCNGGLECDIASGTGVPPATLAEFTLNSSTGSDWYDVSLVDGFNLAMSISNSANCKAPSCSFDLNQDCPESLQVQDTSGQVIGCKTACMTEGHETDCCSGAHSTPATCPVSGVRFYDHFKQCKDAYAYAYDESSESALWTCPSTSQADYTITFCPGGKETPATLTKRPTSTPKPTRGSHSATRHFSFRPIRSAYHRGHGGR